MENNSFSVRSTEYPLEEGSVDIETGGISTLHILNIYYGVIFCLGISANLFVVTMIVYVSRKRVSVTNIYIVNMALADLFFLLWIPFVIARSLIGQWIWGMEMCKFYFISTTVNQFGSVAFLTVLCVDRYLAVCHPIKFQQMRNTKTAVIVAAVCWTVVAVLMTPIYLYSTVVNIVSSIEKSTDTITDDSLGSQDSPGSPESGFMDSPNVQCIIMWPAESVDIGRFIFTMYTGILGYVTPVTVMWTLYSMVLVTVICKRSGLQPQSAKRRQSMRRVTRMVLAVVTAYTVCWAPFWIIQFLIELLDEGVWQRVPGFHLFSLAAYCLQSTNSVLNPVLYCFVSGSYNDFWRCCFCGAGLQTLKPMSFTNGISNPNPNLQQRSIRRQLLQGGSGQGLVEEHSFVIPVPALDEKPSHICATLFGQEEVTCAIDWPSSITVDKQLIG